MFTVSSIALVVCRWVLRLLVCYCLWHSYCPAIDRLLRVYPCGSSFLRSLSCPLRSSSHRCLALCLSVLRFPASVYVAFGAPSSMLVLRPSSGRRRVLLRRGLLGAVRLLVPGRSLLAPGCIDRKEPPGGSSERWSRAKWVLPPRVVSKLLLYTTLDRPSV